MARYQDTIWCDGCGVEILWSPTIVNRLDYCCEACRDGLPCRCGERMKLDEGRRANTGEAADVSAGAAP